MQSIELIINNNNNQKLPLGSQNFVEINNYFFLK